MKNTSNHTNQKLLAAFSLNFISCDCHAKALKSFMTSPVSVSRKMIQQIEAANILESLRLIIGKSKKQRKR